MQDFFDRRKRRHLYINMSTVGTLCFQQIVGTDSATSFDVEDRAGNGIIASESMYALSVGISLNLVASLHVLVELQVQADVQVQVGIAKETRLAMTFGSR